MRRLSPLRPFALSLVLSLLTGWIGGTMWGALAFVVALLLVAVAGVFWMMKEPAGVVRWLLLVALPLPLASVVGGWSETRSLEEAKRWCERYALAGGAATTAPRPSRVYEATAEECAVADGFNAYVYDLNTRRWTSYGGY